MFQYFAFFVGMKGRAYLEKFDRGEYVGLNLRTKTKAKYCCDS